MFMKVQSVKSTKAISPVNICSSTNYGALSELRGGFSSFQISIIFIRHLHFITPRKLRKHIWHLNSRDSYALGYACKFHGKMSAHDSFLAWLYLKNYRKESSLTLRTMTKNRKKSYPAARPIYCSMTEIRVFLDFVFSSRFPIFRNRNHAVLIYPAAPASFLTNSFFRRISPALNGPFGLRTVHFARSDSFPPRLCVVGRPSGSSSGLVLV